MCLYIDNIEVAKIAFCVHFHRATKILSYILSLNHLVTSLPSFSMCL